MVKQIEYKYSEKRRKNIGKGVSKRWKKFGNPKNALGKRWKWTEKQKNKIKGKISHRKGKKLSKEHCINAGNGLKKAFQEKPELHIIWSNAQKGKKSHFWQGGISFEPYGLEFNEDLKEVIRNRDRRKCQISGKTELELGYKLSVHHIDYNKKNNDPKNLISLSKKWHSKTNFNRKYWIEFFKKR